MEQGLSDLQVLLLVWVGAVGDGGYIGNCPSFLQMLLRSSGGKGHETYFKYYLKK